MAKYIYKKYYLNRRYGNWSSVEESLPGKSFFSSDLELSETGYSSYVFNNNSVSSAGSYITITNKGSFGTKVYTNFVNGTGFRGADVKQFLDSGTSNYGRVGISRKVSHSKGSFIEEIIAEDGIYPDDGRYSDGYWYIKDRLAWQPPKIQLKVNNIKKEYNNGWVKINGDKRQIDKISIKINGSLKEA